MYTTPGSVAPVARMSVHDHQVHLPEFIRELLTRDDLAPAADQGPGARFGLFFEVEQLNGLSGAVVDEGLPHPHDGYVVDRGLLVSVQGVLFVAGDLLDVVQAPAALPEIRTGSHVKFVTPCAVGGSQDVPRGHYHPAADEALVAEVHLVREVVDGRVVTVDHAFVEEVFTWNHNL